VYPSLKATPFITHNEQSGEDVLTQLGTKESIHYMHCVHHTLRLAATTEANLCSTAVLMVF